MKVRKFRKTFYLKKENVTMIEQERKKEERSASWWLDRELDEVRRRRMAEVEHKADQRT